MIGALVTLATNRLYFGWPGHSWDAMVLGALLIGVALVLRRWLAAGPEEIRHGFTARRLSGKDKQWMEVATTVIGLTAETPQAPKASAQPQFGGGDSGGGGASSDW